VPLQQVLDMVVWFLCILTNFFKFAHL
jgi:hypothetical protein